VKEEVNNQLDQAIDDRITARIDSAAKEARLREAKKENIIIFNVKESDAATNSDALNEDADQVHKIIQDHLLLSVSKDELKNLARLGPKNDNANRPIKVTIQDAELRKAVLTGAKSLASSEDQTVRNIYIARDQTQKERQEGKDLREERRRRQEELESGGDTMNVWVIRRRKLVMVPKKDRDQDNRPEGLEAPEPLAT
jgi:ribosome-binding ATPase YchF (GTP1/OBG family)